MNTISRRRPVVYIASPITAYRTRRYDRMVALVRRRFPTHLVLAARDLGYTPETWLRRWHRLLPSLDRVVAFADRSGLIGAGVFQEVFDARLFGIPVHIVTTAGHFVPLRGVALRYLAGDSLARFAGISVAGERPVRRSLRTRTLR